MAKVGRRKMPEEMAEAFQRQKELGHSYQECAARGGTVPPHDDETCPRRRQPAAVPLSSRPQDAGPVPGLRAAACELYPQPGGGHGDPPHDDETCPLYFVNQKYP